MAKKETQNTGMIFVASFALLLLGNALVVYVANLLFPQHIELGTHELSVFFALILSMGILAVANTFATPFVHVYENMRGKMFTTTEWMVLYFVINTAGIWVIARFAFQLGFGISSWVVAVALGLVLDFAQGTTMMWLEKYRKALQ